MKKLHVAAFVATLFVAAGIAPSFADGSAVNVAAVKATIASGTATLATSGVQVAADFGQPPSGEIPIIYNDHHVYANPSILRQNRTLSALVKNGVIMVPLRSMFEDMGGSVSYDAKSKTVTAQKTGASVQVTLGKAEAVINGESRPLDVPPMMYKGVLLVPVRVMSEALGGYVQWVPDRRITVVRYIPPTPVPTPPPTPPPTPAPTLPPTPPFHGRDSRVNGNVEYKIWKPANLYIGASYEQNSTNYGYPTLTGVGGGLEVLPRLDQPGGLTWYGSVYDYPSQTGTYTVNDPNSSNFTNTYRTRFNVLQYDVGLNYTIGGSPVFLYGGFNGDRYNGNSVTNISCATAAANPLTAGCPPTTPRIFNRTHSGFYGGLGFKF